MFVRREATLGLVAVFYGYNRKTKPFNEDQECFLVKKTINGKQKLILRIGFNKWEYYVTTHITETIFSILKEDKEVFLLDMGNNIYIKNEDMIDLIQWVIDYANGIGMEIPERY